MEKLQQRINSLIERNKIARAKQTAMVEMVCHLRTRIDRAERRIAENDKEIKKLKKQIIQP